MGSNWKYSKLYRLFAVQYYYIALVFCNLKLNCMPQKKFVAWLQFPSYRYPSLSTGNFFHSNFFRPLVASVVMDEDSCLFNERIEHANSTHPVPPCLSTAHKPRPRYSRCMSKPSRTQHSMYALHRCMCVRHSKHSFKPAPIHSSLLPSLHWRRRLKVCADRLESRKY